MALLIHLTDRDEAKWQAALQAELGSYPVLREVDDFDRAQVEYLFVWKPAPDTFDNLPNLKAVLSLGAGVDGLLRHPRLPDVPLVRFVDDELSQCMADYVVAHATMHHRQFSRFAADQKARRWVQDYPEPAQRITVGVMGLGAIGEFTVGKLLGLGFDVRGWSRSRREIAGVTCFAGREEFGDFLSETDILACLLPLTPETEGILNYATFSKLRHDRLPGGPAIINAARGGHQNEEDIVTALNDGTLGAASLDVFQSEPLPLDSPLWTARNCYVTPHIAAISNERTGVLYFAKAIRDHEAGLPLPNVVDVTRGY